MIGLVSALMFAGYTLIYAAFGEGGKYMLAPWEALKPGA